MPDLASTQDLVEAEISEGFFTRGAQVFVSLGGEVALDACFGDDGLARPIRSNTVFRVYCTIKPVTALAVANLVADGELDLDQPLVDMLAPRQVLNGGVTARMLLNHTAGLHKLSGVTIEMMPAVDRRAELDRQRPPPGWRRGRDAGYSEYAAWTLLGELLEARTGENLREVLRRSVLDPLGMSDTWIGMTHADYEDCVGRLGVNVDLRGFRAYPMLFERTERVCVGTNPAHGGYTTARDLGRLYDALLEARRGRRVDGLPPAETLNEFCCAARPRSYDEVLGRECDYGLGFMVSLEGHFFGSRCSPQSFGHSGNLGSSFAFADPIHSLVVAVVFNGLVDHESAFVRRPRLIEHIYADLGLTTTDASNPPVEVPSGRLFRRLWSRRGSVNRSPGEQLDDARRREWQSRDRHVEG
jgi:CubicO group peptidase (beta-lactamase class C family)